MELKRAVKLGRRRREKSLKEKHLKEMKKLSSTCTKVNFYIFLVQIMS